MKGAHAIEISFESTLSNYIRRTEFGLRREILLYPTNLLTTSRWRRGLERKSDIYSKTMKVSTRLEEQSDGEGNHSLRGIIPRFPPSPDGKP